MTRKASDWEQHAAAHRSVLDAWLSTHPSPNTRAAYRRDLEALGHWCIRRGTNPLTADTSTLVAFQHAREVAGDSDATLRRRWSAWSSFYDFAVEQELSAGNPALGVDRPKVQSGDPSPTAVLSQDAVARCRALAAALDPRLEALVSLLVCDGLKVVEVLALDIGDVEGTSQAMTVTVNRRGKPTAVVVDRTSAQAVLRCVARRRSGPVFVTERSSRSEAPRRLTRFGADHLVRQLRTTAATAQVTANALRRFHITTRQTGGDVLDDIRDGAGLADVRGVKRYIPAAPLAGSPDGASASERQHR